MADDFEGVFGDERAAAAESSPRPLRDRGRTAMLMIGAVGLAALGSLWADANQLDVLNRALDGERVSLSEATRSDDRVAVTATIYLVAYIVSVITFLLWYGRAYRNIRALGVRDPRYGTRWAVAYWFIPIMNLFRPKQVMNDIWRGSDPELPRPAGDWRSRPVPMIMGFWWAAWLISNFVANFAVRATLDAGAVPTPDETRDEATAYVVADVFDVVAAILGMIVIWQITNRQEARRTRFEAGSLAPYTPPPTPPGPAGVVVPRSEGGWECSICRWRFGTESQALGHVEQHHAEYGSRSGTGE